MEIRFYRSHYVFLKQWAFDAEYIHADIGMGLLVQQRQRSSGHAPSIC